MRSLTIKAAAFLLIFFGLAIDARAAQVFQYKHEAKAACEAEGAGTIGNPTTYGHLGTVEDYQCVDGTPNNYVKYDLIIYAPYTNGSSGGSWVGGAVGYASETVFVWEEERVCEAGEDFPDMFANGLEPPPACIDGCEVEATTGTCSDDGNGGYWCNYSTAATGEACDEETPPGEDMPENCAQNADTGAITCDCSGGETGPECYEDEGPDPSEPPLPPNCIEVGDNRICDDWPSYPPPPPEEDPPPGCYVTTHGVMYCPPGQNPDNPTPDPQNPIDTGDPGSSDGPGDSSDGPGTPGEDGPEESCTPGVDCPAERTAETKGGCDDGPPSCSGDPINCAILIQNWKTSCGALDTGDNSPPWEDDPDWGRDLKSEATELTTYEMIDDSGMGGGSCPANRTVAVMNISFELNMEGMCDLAAILKVFVIIAAWIQAAYLLTRAF